MEKVIRIEKGKRYAQPLYSIEYYTNTKNENGESLSRTTVLPPGIPSRDEIINAIIVDEYPSDRMQAVQNNYMLDPENEESKSEFDEMQQWRKMSKEIADEVLLKLNGQNAQSNDGE